VGLLALAVASAVVDAQSPTPGAHSQQRWLSPLRSAKGSARFAHAWGQCLRGCPHSGPGVRAACVCERATSATGRRREANEARMRRAPVHSSLGGRQLSIAYPYCCTTCSGRCHGAPPANIRAVGVPQPHPPARRSSLQSRMRAHRGCSSWCLMWRSTGRIRGVGESLAPRDPFQTGPRSAASTPPPPRPSPFTLRADRTAPATLSRRSRTSRSTRRAPR
jgi:hypothetical protein